jgi:hypothetical protein
VLEFRRTQLRLGIHIMVGWNFFYRYLYYKHLQELEIEMHLIFRFPIYYNIRGCYHCLYRDSWGSLSTFFGYQDQRCLALFIRQILSHRSQLLHTMPCLVMTRTITSYFPTNPLDQSNKRWTEFQSTLDSRLVRSRASPQPSRREDRLLSSRLVWRCRTVHQSRLHTLLES